MIEQIWGWDEAWQRDDFDRRFQQCRVSVIEADDRAAGGLWLESHPDSLYIHDLQLLPEFQGRGIGTAVLQNVITEATSRGNAVTLSVFTINSRARQLYERLGFYVTGANGPFIRMRHDPTGSVARRPPSSA